MVKRNYLSYLLRIWQTGSSESSNWVASLEDPHSHQVIHFKNLEALLLFLQQTTQCEGASPTLAGSLEEKKTE